MYKLKNLIVRNTKLFFSSKLNVLFSMLSILILVLLHFIVFRSMNADGFISSVSQVDEKWALWFSDVIMLSALIPMGAISISIISIGQIVRDKEQGIINDFYVVPVKRTTLLAGYLISSIMVGFVLLTGFVLFFEIYFLIIYQISFTFIQILIILGIMMLCLVLGNTLIFFIISFINKEQTVGALGSILGTTLGFLCGAYIPVGVLGGSITVFFTFLPFLPLTALIRQVFFMNIEMTGLPSGSTGGEVAKMYGYELYVGNDLLSNSMLLGIIFAYVLLLVGLLILRFNSMRKK